MKFMKVVCIKECSYSFNSQDYQFNIGDQFDVCMIQSSFQKHTGKMLIYLPVDRNPIITVLQEDFISLLEWRNKQLNQILDEF